MSFAKSSTASQRGCHTIRRNKILCKFIAPDSHKSSENYHRRVNLAQLTCATNTHTLRALQSKASVNSDLDVQEPYSITRRSTVILSSLLLVNFGSLDACRAEDFPTSSTPAPASLSTFSNATQGYELSIPTTWEKKDKAGADVLFEDPAQRSTSVGVTVNPVRVKDITNFGTVDNVGVKLLEAEKKKESTLSVLMISQGSKQGKSGALLYEYEYELNSTRGRKRILNTVTIFNSKLYILNANLKCGKEECDGTDATLGLLREIAGTFDAQ